MAEVWNIVAVSVLALCCVGGVLATVVRLPGTWAIVVATAAFGWWEDWRRVSLITVAVLGGAAASAELVELLASVVGARRAGASRQAAWGGLIGGLIGMFLFSIPVPLVGTFVGAMVGCFSGAMAVELIIRKQLAQGTRVGFFSAVGFVVGAIAKMAMALVMCGAVLLALMRTAPAPP